MSHYRKIDTRVWNDQKFQSLPDDGKLAFLFLLTHPNLTSFGAMRATMDGLGAELGWLPGRFLEGLREGLLEGLVEHNPKACYIGLKNFIKYNAPENFNVLKSMLKLVELLPECPERDGMFRRTIAHVLNENKGFGGQEGLFIEQLRKLLPEGLSEGLPKGYRDSLNPEPRTLNISNPPLPPTGEDASKPSRKERNAKERQVYDEEFSKAWEEIVNLTPNASKAPSAKAWATCRKDGISPEDILGWYRAFAQDKTERRFVTGFHKIAEPVTIRAWMCTTAGGPLGDGKQEQRTGPSKEAIERAMANLEENARLHAENAAKRKAMEQQKATA